MTRDRGVTPGLVERSFRRSNWATYVELTGRQHAKAAMVERGLKLSTKERDLEALEATQASRPAKPPGRR